MALDVKPKTGGMRDVLASLPRMGQKLESFTAANTSSEKPVEPKERSRKWDEVEKLRDDIETSVENDNYEKSLEEANKILDLDPKDVHALTVKAWALGELGRHEEAIEWYDKVLEIEPKDVDALFNKAWALGELGRDEEAIECYDKEL